MTAAAITSLSWVNSVFSDVNSVANAEFNVVGVVGLLVVVTLLLLVTVTGGDVVHSID